MDAREVKADQTGDGTLPGASLRAVCEAAQEHARRLDPGDYRRLLGAIEASPQMLAACKQLADIAHYFAEGDHDPGLGLHPKLAAALAAIARAEGCAPEAEPGE